MTITALPTPPTRSDPTNFASRADTFLAALPTFATEANALAAAMNLNATTDTSTTSNLIGTGSKTFTVSSGKSFQPGMYLMLADTAAPSTNAMIGQVTSYTGTSLVVNVKAVIGSGTKTAWTISQSVPTADMGVFTTLQATSGLNSTAVGNTTPSTGSFTTLAASGTITQNGTSGAATTNIQLFPANTAAQYRVVWNNAGADFAGIGSDASGNIILGRASTLAGAVSSTQATLSSTGLAVTGALSASITDNTSTTGIKGGTKGIRFLTQSGFSTIDGVDSTLSASYQPIKIGGTTTTIHSSGSDIATFDTSGNFGLGITPSAWSVFKAVQLPSSALFGYDGGTGNRQTSIGNNTYYDGVGYKYTATDLASFYKQYAGTHSWFTATSGTAGTAITFTQAMTLDASGNLGIGVTPSAWRTNYHAIELGPCGTSVFGDDAAHAYLTQNTYFDSGGSKYKATGTATVLKLINTGGMQVLTAPSGSAGTASTFTQSLAVGKGTSLALEGATSAAGTGIAFPATQLASSDANTLDDYREGTWTGTLSATTSNPTTPVTATGRYTKVGRAVHAHISFNAVTTTGAVGNIFVSGLPFASAATYDVYGTAALGANGTAVSVSQIPASSSSVSLVDALTTVAIPIVAGTSKYYAISITYYV